jgi:hypothetical protein
MRPAPGPRPPPRPRARRAPPAQKKAGASLELAPAVVFFLPRGRDQSFSAISAAWAAARRAMGTRKGEQET